MSSENKLTNYIKILEIKLISQNYKKMSKTEIIDSYYKNRQVDEYIQNLAEEFPEFITKNA